MKRALGIIVPVLGSLFLPAAVNAATINGGFEDSLTGWQAVGDYRVETSSFGSGPVEGTSQAFLSTANDEVTGVDQNGNDIRGGDAVPVTFITGSDSLEGFLGLSTFFEDKSLSDIATAEPIEGSAIKQTFTASAGQVISFSWNFLTDESTGQGARGDNTYPEFNDFAFASIQSDSDTKLFSLAETISNFNNSSTLFGKETGFQNFSYTVPTTGDYTLGIGVVDVGEPTRISGLLVDDVRAVPEPSSTLGMLFLGAGLISVLRRKQKVGNS